MAAGKTAVGRLLSSRLGYRFLDTGSMYRALTWLAVQKGVAPQDEQALIHLAHQASIQVSQRNGEEQVYVDGAEVTQELRQPEVEQRVSLVSRIPGVREAMVRLQQALAQGGRIVMSGRDIGTVVLPDAELKCFLVASPEERARRRHRELREQGYQVSYQQVLQELLDRDRLDSERAYSPLRPAPDACLLDTDGISVEQVVEKILSLIEGGNGDRL